MRSISSIAELKATIRDLRSQGKVLGLVPTMGNLHAGHLQLVTAARQEVDWVVCSIFVNPMQFGPAEDLDAYPRTLEEDRTKLEEYQCDCLFHPAAREVYPQGLQAQTLVSVPELGRDHCGKSRPGHFDGVTTVVSKLFNLCQPDRAYFGLKDYQQFLIIQKMVEDLLFPVELVGVETVRETDGLAMSSRNNYLILEERQKAPALYRTLVATGDAIKAGELDFRKLESAARQQLQEAGLQPDYFSICHGETLRPASASDSKLAILAAAYLGKSRLIDNVRLTLLR
jgi:pantoate--beta-alanine ligase